MAEDTEPARELTELVRDLMEDQRVAVLSTYGAAGPYASLVAFAYTPDLKRVLFATARATRKFANITGDPRVALLIDSRSKDDEGFQRAAAATVTGPAREPAPEDRESLISLYVARHPQLKGFVSRPDCALVEVSADTYHVVTRFQHVRELRP